MAFKDLRELTQGTHLDLPIGGVTYRIDDVDGETGLLVQQLMDVGLEAYNNPESDVDLGEDLLDDAREMDLYKDVLGEALPQMLGNGVKWDEIKRAATTAMVWICFDEETAEKFWESGGDAGEAQAPTSGPNRAARRASAATGRTTRKRASGTATRASRSTPKTTAARSRGATSGSNGAS